LIITVYAKDHLWAIAEDDGNVRVGTGLVHSDPPRIVVCGGY